MSICVNCGADFTLPKKSKRKTCSRSCAVALSWGTNGDQRLASIKAARGSAESRAKSVETNRRRWSDPAQHERLSEWNRRRWADPVIRSEQAARLAAAQRTPKKRKFYSELRTRQWREDEEYRARTIAGIRRSKGSVEARTLFSELLRQRWESPILRPKYLAAVIRNARNPALRQRNRERMLARWADPVSRPQLMLSIARGVQTRTGNVRKKSFVRYLQKTAPVLLPTAVITALKQGIAKQTAPRSIFDLKPRSTVAPQSWRRLDMVP